VAKFSRSTRGRSSRRPRRNVKWLGAQWAFANLTMNARPGESQWTSFWVRWPSSAVDQASVSQGSMPLDETLVRTILNCQLVWQAVAPGVTNPVFATLGLIAFDGGQFPEFYDLTIFQEGASFVAPPNPNLENDDDWIIRLPFVFCTDGAIQQPGSNLFIESRAQRKLPPGTGLLAVLAAYSVIDEANTPTFYFGADFRCLLKSGQAADPV